MLKVEEGDIPEEENFASFTILQTGLAHFQKMLSDLPASEVSLRRNK